MPYEPFPWASIIIEQSKIVSKLNDTLIPLDFSSKSLKHWLQFFLGLFNKKFITDRMARLAVIYNSCSLPLQTQILSMDMGSKAKVEEFSYKVMLQVIAVLSNCPNHAEAALQVLYSGIRQDHSESVTVYLEGVRAIAEDAYGPATRLHWLSQRL